MKRRHHVSLRILTYSHVAITSILLGCGLVYFYSFKSLQATLNATNEMFNLITQSQQQLSNRIEHLANSPNLKHSLEKNLPTLLQGELRSGLRPGLLDAITLSSESCDMEIKISSPGHKAPNCQDRNQTPLDEIRSSEEFPILFSVRRIDLPESNGNFWLQAQVDLDEAWFNQDTDAKQEFFRQSLTLSNKNHKYHNLNFLKPSLSESTKLAIEASGLSLTTSDPVKGITLKMLHHLNHVLPQGLWIFLGLQLGLGIVLLLVQKFQTNAETNALKKYSSAASKSLPELKLDMENLELDEVFQKSLASFNKRVEDWESQNSKLMQKIAQQDLNLRGAQQKLRSMRDMREDSIYGAMDRKIFLYFIDQSLRSLAWTAEESKNIKARTIGIQNNTLANLSDLLEEWTKGIEARGARKFIRSLDETEFNRGVSNLEQQLSSIIQANREISNTFEQIQTSGKQINQSAIKQSATLHCLKQLILKRPLRCDEFYRSLLILNNFYNDISAANLNMRISHNFTGTMPSLFTEVMPILHYFYFHLNTTEHALKMPSILHKIELGESALVHAFYFTSQAEWIQRQMRKDNTDSATKAMQEWAEHCNIKIHVIPQGRDSCALIIRERLKNETSPSLSQLFSRNESSSLVQ